MKVDSFHLARNRLFSFFISTVLRAFQLKLFDSKFLCGGFESAFNRLGRHLLILYNFILGSGGHFIFIEGNFPDV